MSHHTLLVVLLSALLLLGCKEQQSSSSSSTTSSQPSSSSTSGSSSPSPSSSSPTASRQSMPSVPAPSSSPSSATPSTPTAGQQNNGQDQNQPQTTQQGHTTDGAPMETAPSSMGNESVDDSAMGTAMPAPSSPSDDIDFSEEEAGAPQTSTYNHEQSSPANSTPSMTRAEQVAILEAQLEGSMADYDGMILREREYVLSRGNQEGSEEQLEEAVGGGLPYEEASLEEESALPYEETDPDLSESSGGGYRPEGPSDNREGDYQHQGTAAPPADIPDGSDDDVVARQIREAAMSERDPVLREKLWEEYRKYKNSQ